MKAAADLAVELAAKEAQLAVLQVTAAAAAKVKAAGEGAASANVAGGGGFASRYEELVLAAADVVAQRRVSAVPREAAAATTTRNAAPNAQAPSVAAGRCGACNRTLAASRATCARCGTACHSACVTPSTERSCPGQLICIRCKPP